MALISSFVAGILAAFTPCILVLFPALIYRFTNTPKERLVKEVGAFVISFVAVFFLAAFFLNELLSSTIKQGFQLGIGLLFVTLGTLALLRRFNPLQFPLIKNPLLFGMLFAVLASVNPCSFAYLGIIATTGQGMLITSFLLFALGLLLPSLLFVLFGKTLFSRLKKTQKVMKYISNMMNLLLVAMGVYLMIKISSLGKADIIMAVILLGLTFLILLRAFFFFQGRLTITRALLLLALVLIMISAVWHCDAHIQTQDQNRSASPNEQVPPHFQTAAQQTAAPTCSADPMDCTVCRRCTLTFAAAAALGSVAILMTRIGTRQA